MTTQAHTEHFTLHDVINAQKHINLEKERVLTAPVQHEEDDLFLSALLIFALSDVQINAIVHEGDFCTRRVQVRRCEAHPVVSNATLFSLSEWSFLVEFLSESRHFAVHRRHLEEIDGEDSLLASRAVSKHLLATEMTTSTCPL